MKLYYSLLVFLFSTVFIFNIYSQKATPVLEMKTTALLPVNNPILIDSTDVNNKAFEAKNLLQTFISFDDIKKSNNILKAANDSVFTLESISADVNTKTPKRAVQLYSFNIDPDRYCKV